MIKKIIEKRKYGRFQLAMDDLKKIHDAGFSADLETISKPENFSVKDCWEIKIFTWEDGYTNQAFSIPGNAQIIGG